MERAAKPDGFRGEIGQNIPSTNAEKEEDLLEVLYLWWKSEKTVTPSEICIQLDITRRELKYLVRQMAKHGYLKETQDCFCMELTDFGKSQGAECVDRHQYLSQFLQMVCGLEEKKAYEDACRMEHVISREAVQGVCEFLKYGDTYDRVMRNMDLREMYESGIYEFRMGIYRTEKRYPRLLADEFYHFSDKICLDVNEVESSFYLQPKPDEEDWIFWYQDHGEWKKAEREEQGYRIPSEMFAFTVSAELPITEGDVVVGFTREETEPVSSECRELNVHIW